jgi:hypothetical protein
MYIVDVGIEDDNMNGKIESGEMINLTVRIGNKGKGTARSAYAKLYAGDNVFITETYPKTVKMGELAYNDYIDIPLEFFVNDKTVDEIPLYVDLTEENSLANVSKLRLPIKKSERARKIQRTVVAGIDQEYGELTLGADLSIDIEQNIPVTGQKNENALAIVFGIENYRNVSPVTFAKRDATFMKEYFEKTLGIPASNIYFKTDENVGKADFDKVFSKRGWLDKRADENTDIYIYYAGHGAPQIKENKAYLIPYDGDPNYASQTGYALDVLYANLGNLKARSVTVFLDACFTGANRESEILLAGARPMFMEVNPSAAGNITIFSAASGKEISSAWPEKRHGLFSYFLMKGMRGDGDANKDGQLTMDELGSYIQTNVSRQAGFLDREQTPQLQTLEKGKVLIQYK